LTPEAALERLCTSEKAEASWFTPSFLAAIPLTKVDALTESIRKRVGAYKILRALGGDKYEVICERGAFRATIHIDQAGAITGIRRSPAPSDGPTDCIRACWRQMALSVAFCGVVFAWVATHGGRTWSLATVGGISLSIVVAFLFRVRGARRALAVRDDATIERWAAGQRQSHRVRGRVFLVVAPVILGVMWRGLLHSPRVPLDESLVNGVVTIFIVGAWVVWFRAVHSLGPLERSRRAATSNSGT